MSDAHNCKGEAMPMIRADMICKVVKPISRFNHRVSVTQLCLLV